MNTQEQIIFNTANRLLAGTKTAAICIELADGKSAYLGDDAGVMHMLQNKDQSGAAVRGEAVAVLVPKFAGQLDTFQEWVNKAQSRLASPEHRRAICVDAKGRRMTCGADFMKARDDGDFPVRYFWECELAPAAQWACPDCGNSQQFDHRGCIKPVSRRAADAPSEPSELLSFSANGDLMQELENVLMENNWRGDLVERIRESRAADALDSQPTDAAMALLREVVDMRDIAETFASGAQVSDEFDALRGRIVAFLASSQPTDGGVRNG